MIRHAIKYAKRIVCDDVIWFTKARCSSNFTLGAQHVSGSEVPLRQSMLLIA